MALVNHCRGMTLEVMQRSVISVQKLVVGSSPRLRDILGKTLLAPDTLVGVWVRVEKREMERI